MNNDNNNTINDGLNNIKNMYSNLTYFDQYSGSVILFIIITIIVALLVSYFYTMANIQPVINNWATQRCKPNIIPFAGLINPPTGTSAFDYTAENFTYCMQNILTSVTEKALEPITFVTNSLKSMAGETQDSIQNARGMFDHIRTAMQSVTQEIMGRLMNFMIPLIQIIIGFKDFIGKLQGTLTASLYTFLDSYFTLRSLMGVIAKFIISILIALSAMIATFWLFPFTWGAAVANTSIFVAIAVPMAVILSFMSKTLHIDTSSYKIPKVKCFDKDTLIRMDNGTFKKIINIEVGDILEHNNVVTAKVKVAAEGSDMYLLNNIFVSDSHIVKYGKKWIPVSKHPMAIKHILYDEPFLYCLNTTHKIIKINNTIFTDWDEIYDDSLIKVINNNQIPIPNPTFIHKYLDCGFSGDTIVSGRKISELSVGDILDNGENIYGIVEINGRDLNLGVKEDKLYHLLTDTGTFIIGKDLIKDYNYAIDQFLGEM